MTDAPSIPTSTSPADPATGAILTAIEARDEQDTALRRRLAGVFAPVLLVLLVAALALVARAHRPAGLIQFGIGLLAWGEIIWARRTDRVGLSMAGLLVGLFAVTTLLINVTGPLSGHVTFATITAFFLLLLPIIVAGLITELPGLLLTASASLLYTAILLAVVRWNVDLGETVAHRGGVVLLIIPFAIEALTTVLMLERMRGIGRLRRRLATAEATIAREKELVRLRTQFITNVNHELRTPIMAAQGYLALALELDRQDDAAGRRQMLTEGSKVIDELIQLVKSVLNVRRIDGGTPPAAVAFALAPAIMRAVDLRALYDLSDDDRAVQVAVPDDLVVLADAERLHETLINLLANAVKYSAAGSPIEVTGRVLPATSATRRGINATAAAEVAVRDYGLGIPPEQIDLLFEPFVRLERDIASPVVGTGLGLAICRTHIEAMGGRIWVESNGIPGEGATFYFTLPLASEYATQAMATTSV